MFFSILLFSNGQALRQNTLNSLHSLKLTLSNSHLSISLPPARLDSQRHQPIEAQRHQPTSWSISSNSQADPSPKTLIHALDPRLWSVADPHLRPISAFSDALNSLKLSPLNPHLSIPPLPPPTRLAFRWVVSIFFIYMLRIFDLGNWNDKFIIFVESNDKSLRIGMYWKFSVCRNLCFYF